MAILARTQSKLINFCDEGVFYGGAERDRTADLLVANEALSQLSYSPPPNPHRAPLSQAQRSRNNISECTSNHTPAQPISLTAT